jgi:hypothetical protein
VLNGAPLRVRIGAYLPHKHDCHRWQTRMRRLVTSAP